MATVEEPIALDSTLQRVADALEGGSIATTSKAGKVMPDGASILVDTDGTIHALNGRYLNLRSIGTSYTAEMKADIVSGKFETVRVGDYLTINGHVYYFAHPDYWYNTGDTACTTHHMLVVPAGNLGTGKMNSDNDTAGAYIGSGLKSGTNHDSTSNTALSDVAEIIKADFGAANILTHRELFANTVTDGKASNWAVYDSDVDLMNEVMVYGHNAWSSSPQFDTGIDKSQILLFQLRPDLITIRAYWWLRSVESASYVALVDRVGHAIYAGASFSYGVRPVFAIC